MKSKKTESSSIFKKKGFYAALYSCVGMVLVMAAVITYNTGNNSLPVPNDYAANNAVDLSELQSVSQSSVRSYLNEPIVSQAPAVASITSENDTAFFKPKVSEPAEDTEEPKEETKEENKEAEKVVEPKKEETKEETTTTDSQDTLELETASIISELERQYETAQVVASGFDGLEIASSQFAHAMLDGDAHIDEMLTEPVFNIFADDQNMSWPVVGEIVMDFSPDRTIYDKTLEQFRTNHSISIQADSGTSVRAAAEGIVREISNTRENGTSVVVDHGNGWTTTYSQLDANSLITEGDVVSKNQEIGKIGEPSIYRVLLGNHLDFSVTKNDVATDPKAVLN